MNNLEEKKNDIDRDIDILARLFVEMEDKVEDIKVIQIKYLHEHKENENQENNITFKHQ